MMNNGTKIDLYQWHLSDEDFRSVEFGGIDANPVALAWYKKGFSSFDVVPWFDHYTKVAEIFDAKDLEEAFELTNLWEQPAKVNKIARCHSMSVGDVVTFEENGVTRAFACSGVGWKEITDALELNGPVPHQSAELLSCDQVAECYDGVSPDLYESLWNAIDDVEETVEAEMCGSRVEYSQSNGLTIADRWACFTVAEKLEINQVLANEEAA